MNIKQLGRVGTLSIVVGIGGSTAVSAQTTPRVAVSVEAGTGGGGATGQLEDFLRSAGMTDQPLDVSYFGGARDNPHSDVATATGWNIRVRVRPRLSVEVSASTSSDGSTHAFRYGSSAYYEWKFDADYSVRSVATLINWHPTPRLRVGAGPALHRVTFNNPVAEIEIRESMFGWTAQAGYAFLNRKRIFSEITAHYRGMGSTAVDPVTLTEGVFFDQLETLTLPAIRVSYSHWVIGLSFGLKLLK